MKCATPGARAPCTSVSPIASMMSASASFKSRNGKLRARASRAVSMIVEPPTVKASAPNVAPFMKARLWMVAIRRFLPLAAWHAALSDPLTRAMADYHPRAFEPASPGARGNGWDDSRGREGPEAGLTDADFIGKH